MVFTGTYEHTIDQKHRLAIPAEIRSTIQRQAGKTRDAAVSLYVTIGFGGPGGNALSLYTEEDFEKRAAQLDDSQLDTRAVLEYEQLYLSIARKVELDKQGRVLLPENLINRAGLKSEVVIIGVKDHLEIRDRQTWLEYVDRRLREEPGILVNPRLVMRRRETTG